MSRYLTEGLAHTGTRRANPGPMLAMAMACVIRSGTTMTSCAVIATQWADIMSRYITLIGNGFSNYSQWNEQTSWADITRMKVFWRPMSLFHIMRSPSPFAGAEQWKCRRSFCACHCRSPGVQTTRTPTLQSDLLNEQISWADLNYIMAPFFWCLPLTMSRHMSRHFYTIWRHWTRSTESILLGKIVAVACFRMSRHHEQSFRIVYQRISW